MRRSQQKLHSRAASSTHTCPNQDEMWLCCVSRAFLKDQHIHFQPFFTGFGGSASQVHFPKSISAALKFKMNDFLQLIRLLLRPGVTTLLLERWRWSPSWVKHSPATRYPTAPERVSVNPWAVELLGLWESGSLEGERNSGHFLGNGQVNFNL